MSLMRFTEGMSSLDCFTNSGIIVRSLLVILSLCTCTASKFSPFLSRLILSEISKSLGLPASWPFLAVVLYFGIPSIFARVTSFPFRYATNHRHNRRVKLISQFPQHLSFEMYGGYIDLDIPVDLGR